MFDLMDGVGEGEVEEEGSMKERRKALKKFAVGVGAGGGVAWTEGEVARDEVERGRKKDGRSTTGGVGDGRGG